jgi:hypothetical protein
MKGLGALAAVLLGVVSAAAHVNDRGMDYSVYKDGYGQSCCNVQDCRPAADFVETVVDGAPVVRLLIDGTWVTVSRTFVIAAAATDGRAHFCGRLPGRTATRLT